MVEVIKAEYLLKATIFAISNFTASIKFNKNLNRKKHNRSEHKIISFKNHLKPTFNRYICVCVLCVFEYWIFIAGK